MRKTVLIPVTLKRTINKSKKIPLQIEILICGGAGFLNYEGEPYHK